MAGGVVTEFERAIKAREIAEVMRGYALMEAVAILEMAKDLCIERAGPPLPEESEQE